MGFSLYNLGNILPCRIESQRIIYSLPTGMEVRCPTQFTEDVPQQRNIFTGKTIAFYLKLSDGRDLIGRFDGSISIYRGRLLVGLNNWSVPTQQNLVRCGVVRSSSGIDWVYKSTLDNMSLMSSGARQTSILFKEDLSLQYACQDAMTLACTRIDLTNCIGTDCTPLHWIPFTTGGNCHVTNFT